MGLFSKSYSGEEVAAIIRNLQAHGAVHGAPGFNIGAMPGYPGFPPVPAGPVASPMALAPGAMAQIMRAQAMADPRFYAGPNAALMNSVAPVPAPVQQAQAAAVMAPQPGMTIPPQQANPQSPPVTWQEPTEQREFPLGIDSVVDIPQGGSLTIQTQVQLPFRGKRLILETALAQAFLIGSIFVGTQFQGAALTALPGFLFVPEGICPLELDTANRGDFIAIGCTNNGNSNYRFQALLQGDVVR